MKVRVIRGTNQIGGTITEISSEKAKIIIDFGECLPSEEQKKKIEKTEIDGLTSKPSKYDAVLITHSHGDHIGLINEINDDIEVYVENASKKIHNLTSEFTHKKEVTRTTINFNFGKKIKIKDMTITPYIIDHSSYNSCMFLIESGGKRILHTGDYRSHGRKGGSFEDTLRKIGKVDLLITEGTTLGRETKVFQKEDDLRKEATEIFRNYNQVFILQSSTNVDRIVSFYKASKATNKTFIEDLFTTNITSNIGGKIPRPGEFKDVFLWVPLRYKKDEDEKTIFYEKYIKPIEQYKNNGALHKDFTMLVKASMLSDIRLLQKKNLINNACLIYSMWDGYRQQDYTRKFIQELENMGIKFIPLHTSGHADRETMKKVNEILNPDKTVIIHTDNKQKAKEIFQNIVDLEDNVELDIGSDFMEKLIRRYLKKEGLENEHNYVTRIRGTKDKPELIVYYNGIKYFDYINNKFNLNKSVFLPNSVNMKSLEFDNIPPILKSDTEAIEKMGFKFIVGSVSREYPKKGKKFDLEFSKSQKGNDGIKNILKTGLKKYFPNLDVSLGHPYLKKEKKYLLDKPNKYMFFINEDIDKKGIKYSSLYNLLLYGYKTTISSSSNINLEVKSIDFSVSLVIDNIEKLDFNKTFTKLDDIMRRRINIYCDENIDHEGDLINTKGKGHQEKQYQQKLMDIMNDNKRKKDICKRSFFTLDTYPFEMEYTMYSKNKNEKEITTRKGRIDNIFVRNKTLVMVELKIGTSVIAGTNGIHKHLLDLCNSLENNKEAIEEAYEVIKNKKEILEKYEGFEDYIFDIDTLDSKEYYIICGYNKKEKKKVLNELKRIYDKKITDKELFIDNEGSYSKVTHKAFLESLKQYDKKLTNMTILEYIEYLKRFDCPVSIILADEDYKKFDTCKCEERDIKI